MPETTQDSGHPATFVGRVRRAYTFDRGITLRPPARTAAGASANWRRAFHACFEAVGCVATGAATVSIAEVTGPSGFPSASGNLFDAVPVYVVIWQPSGSCVTVDATSCRQVELIPVSSLKLTYAFQVAAGVPVPATS